MVCLRINKGQLFHYICSKKQFVESDAACFIYQLLDAIEYLHNCYIAHLDIKVKRHLLFLGTFVSC